MPSLFVAAGVSYSLQIRRVAKAITRVTPLMRQTCTCYVLTMKLIIGASGVIANLGKQIGNDTHNIAHDEQDHEIIGVSEFLYVLGPEI